MVGWSDVGNRFCCAAVSSLTNHEAFTVIDVIIICFVFLGINSVFLVCDNLTCHRPPGIEQCTN